MKCVNSNFKYHLKLEFIPAKKHFVTVISNKLITPFSKQTIKTLNHRSLKNSIKTPHKISPQIFFTMERFFLHITQTT